MVPFASTAFGKRATTVLFRHPPLWGQHKPPTMPDPAWLFLGGRGGPGPHLGRSFRVLHLHQDGVGNQDPTINLSENIRTARSDEIDERAGVGNDDHASGYPVFVGSNRSNVVMSLSRSS